MQDKIIANASKGIRTRYFKIGCRYFEYLPVFEAREIFGIIDNLGGKLIAKLPTPEFGQRIGITGHIAEKDGNLIYVDTDKQIFRVVSFDMVDISISSNLLSSIVNAIKEFYGVTPSFYELLWELIIDTDKNALEIFRKNSEKILFLDEINSRLDFNLSLFGIRLCEGEPNSQDWIDIRIEPEIHRNGENYYMNIIIRQGEWNKFREHIENVATIISTLLRSLEFE